jgi:hypothetical protein
MDVKKDLVDRIKWRHPSSTLKFEQSVFNLGNVSTDTFHLSMDLQLTFKIGLHQRRAKPCPNVHLASRPMSSLPKKSTPEKEEPIIGFGKR